MNHQMAWHIIYEAPGNIKGKSRLGAPCNFQFCRYLNTAYFFCRDYHMWGCCVRPAMRGVTGGAGGEGTDADGLAAEVGPPVWLVKPIDQPSISI